MRVNLFLNKSKERNEVGAFERKSFQGISHDNPASI